MSLKTVILIDKCLLQILYYTLCFNGLFLKHKLKKQKEKKRIIKLITLEPSAVLVRIAENSQHLNSLITFYLNKKKQIQHTIIREHHKNQTKQSLNYRD